MGEVVSLLERPVYTYPQVDRVLGLSDGTALRWLNGYKRRGISYPPILRQEPRGTRWVNWGEFLEARLLAGYRDFDKIPVQRMRRVVEELREQFDRTYPLACAAPYVQAAGRRMLWQAQEDAGLPDVFAVEVGTGQISLAPWVTDFVESASFEDTGDAAITAIQPDRDFPAITLNPSLRGGEPVIDGRNVRVTTIAGLVRGGEDLRDVAEWYELAESDVRQAVEYDRRHARIA